MFPVYWGCFQTPLPLKHASRSVFQTIYLFFFFLFFKGKWVMKRIIPRTLSANLNSVMSGFDQTPGINASHVLRSRDVLLCVADVLLLLITRSGSADPLSCSSHVLFCPCCMLFWVSDAFCAGLVAATRLVSSVEVSGLHWSVALLWYVTYLCFGGESLVISGGLCFSCCLLFCFLFFLIILALIFHVSDVYMTDFVLLCFPLRIVVEGILFFIFFVCQYCIFFFVLRYVMLCYVMLCYVRVLYVISTFCSLPPCFLVLLLRSLSFNVHPCFAFPSFYIYMYM